MLLMYLTFKISSTWLGCYWEHCLVMLLCTYFRYTCLTDMYNCQSVQRGILSSHVNNQSQYCNRYPPRIAGKLLSSMQLHRTLLRVTYFLLVTPITPESLLFKNKISTIFSKCIYKSFHEFGVCLDTLVDLIQTLNHKFKWLAKIVIQVHVYTHFSFLLCTFKIAL